MGDDLTSSCFVNVNGDVDVQSGYNLGKSNEPAQPARYNFLTFPKLS